MEIYRSALLYFTIITLFLSLPILVNMGNIYFKRAMPARKEKIIRAAILTSPVWISAAVTILAIRMPDIFSNGFVIFDILTVLSFLTLVLLYFALALWPAYLAHATVTTSNNPVSTTTTPWALLDKLKNDRLLIAVILSITLAGIIGTDIYLFLRINAEPAAVVIAFIFLIIYLAAEVTGYDRINLPSIDHPKHNLLQNKIDTVSIRNGITTPDFKVISFDNPTAFSLLPNFSKPIIFITTPLLNIADDNELEAVISHEVAHITSGRIFYLRTVNNLLSVLRLAGYVFLFLSLYLINSYLIIVLFLIALYAFSQTLETRKNDFETGENHSTFQTIMVFLNPPFLIINFISYIIYYTNARNEEFYADIKTVESTRYPKGIYSIVNKIENYPGTKKPLPEEFGHLYFTGEGTVFGKIPPSQPLMEERKEILQTIDATLSAIDCQENDPGYDCPACKEKMASLMAKGHFGNNLAAYHCATCDILWFDGATFWCIADLPNEIALNDSFANPEKQSAENDIEIFCPHCGMGLPKQNDKSLPKNINIKVCPACAGILVSRESAISYLKFREEFLKKT